MNAVPMTTPLMLALLNKGAAGLECAQLLIHAGADVNQARSEADFTPLVYAADAGLVEVAKLLLENGADVNQGVKLSSGVATPMTLAVLHNHRGVIELLAQYGGKESGECVIGIHPEED